MTTHGFLFTIGTTLVLTATLATAQVHVQGYTRKDGVHVDAYQRTAPDQSRTNNYSAPGNYNPNTGQLTGGDPARLQAPTLREPTPSTATPSLWDTPTARRR